MRLRWSPLPLERLVADLQETPAAVLFCAQATLGPTTLIMVEFARPGEADHYDQIELWLDHLEQKIDAIERARQLPQATLVPLPPPPAVEATPLTGRLAQRPPDSEPGDSDDQREKAV
jgi:hypothetical protein